MTDWLWGGREGGGETSCVHGYKCMHEKGLCYRVRHRALSATPDDLSCCLEFVAFGQHYESSNNLAVTRKAFATVANVLGEFIRQIREFLAMANVASG